MKLKSHLSVCLSVHVHFLNADNSAVSTSIRMGLARNTSYVFEETKFIFTSLQNLLFIDRSVKDKGVTAINL